MQINLYFIRKVKELKMIVDFFVFFVLSLFSFVLPFEFMYFKMKKEKYIMYFISSHSKSFILYEEHETPTHNTIYQNEDQCNTQIP